MRQSASSFAMGMKEGLQVPVNVIAVQDRIQTGQRTFKIRSKKNNNCEVNASSIKIL